MQTFLPYGKNFVKNAQVLDNKRLGKQRVENLQIINCLCGVSKGWRNHPAVRMWAGYEKALLAYQAAICSEWTDRGYKDTCLIKSALVIGHDPFIQGLLPVIPWWLDDEDVESKVMVSHQSNLVRKLSDHYAPHFPTVPNDIPYHWPV